jgi:DNA (cytosine-5)-methyltransferase 1
VRIGSLFSGAGGLDMAVEAVFGGHTVWQSEIDPAASKVLAYRWGKRRDVPNLGDITAVDWYEVPEIDVLCGGFPCQDVSAAGKRAGIKDGTRSGLWAVFADIIDIIRPPIVVIENVRGLLSAEAHRDVESDEGTVGDGAGRPVLRAAGAVLGDLADLGYDARWATVSAASVGAPHRRERVFIVAQSGSAAVGFNTGGASGAEAGTHPGDRSGDHRGTRADVDRIGYIGHRDRYGVPYASNAELLPTPAAGNFNDGEDAQHWLARQAAVKERLNNGNGMGMPLAIAVQLLPTPNASDCTDGGAHPDNREGHSRQLIDFALLAGSTAWGKYKPAIRRWESLTRPAPAPTEPNKNGNRRLSAAFSEWLMGWPAGWVTDPAIGISRNDQLRIIGNGVVVQQAAAALRQLVAVTA